MTETSLFLRQLAHGPVRWRAFDRDALAEARARELPLLVFAGDALDHWTAALVAALIADGEVCALVDAAFVPVAIDVAREPAAARRIQEALALTADSRGWPAVAFLDADARPFGAVPYRPLRDEQREKGLARILVEVAERWSDARDDCLADAARVADAIARMYASFADDGRRFDPELVLTNAEAQAMAIADPVSGGFGAAPRHPNPPLLEFLIARCARADAPLALTRQVERTLAALAAGGLHDHLGGGFFRASTDASWTVPFFEKRLADNAQLALVFLRAHAVFGRDFYREIAERTLRFCLSAFALGDGRFARGLHADSRDARGVYAGAYATWTRDEIAAVVGGDGADLVCRRFGVAADGDLRDGPGAGRSVLAVRGDVDQRELATLPPLMHRLAVARAEREAPPRDETIDIGGAAQLLVALRTSAAPDLVGDAEAIDRALADQWQRWMEDREPRWTWRDAVWRALSRTIVAPADGSGDADYADDHAASLVGHVLAEGDVRRGHAIRCGSPSDDPHGLGPAPVLTPPVLDLVDDDAPCAAALVARWSALRTTRRLSPLIEPRELLAPHLGLLRRAPLAAPSLCLAVEELAVAGRWRA